MERYEKPDCLTCGSGTTQMPRLRKSYDLKIIQKYERMTEAMKRLLPELYLLGLAIGDFEVAFGCLLCENAPLSSSSVLQRREKWQLEYYRWKNHDLELDNVSDNAHDGILDFLRKLYNASSLDEAKRQIVGKVNS